MVIENKVKTQFKNELVEQIYCGKIKGYKLKRVILPFYYEKYIRDDACKCVSGTIKIFGIPLEFTPDTSSIIYLKESDDL